MRYAGAVGGRGRVESSPAMVAGRAGSGAVRPGAGVSTERPRAAGSAAGRSWLRALATAGPWLRCLAGRRRTSGSSRAGAQGPGGSGSSHPSPVPARPARRGSVAGCNRRGAVVRFRRLAASCAGLVVLAALAVAAPARAQDTTLVTNTSISTSADTDTGSVEYAQGFRTGGNTAGYTVTEIDIKINSQSSTVPPTVMLVKGYPRSANRVTLQGPASIPANTTNQTVTYTARTGTPLDASTTYFVTVSHVSTNNVAAPPLLRSMTDSQSGESGWSIDDIYKWRNMGGTSYTDQAQGHSLLIAVRGTATNTNTNTAPTAANGTVTTGANTLYGFAYADFNYRDADRDRLSSVKIVTLPATGKGTLKLDTANVSAGDTVTRAELDTGKLTYAPPSSGSGTGFASFTFKVNDGASDSATYTMTIDVTATPAHCTSPQSNELWCGTMTVGTQTSPPLYGYNKFSGLGSITPDKFTHNGNTFVVNALANNGNPPRRLTFVLGRYFDPNYSTNFHECLLSRLGSSRLTLEFGTGGNKKTAPLVVEPGPRIHFNMYPYAGSWSAGDMVQVKLLRVPSPGAPSQSRPFATAVRSTTNPYDSIDVSWNAVTTVCGQPVEGYEIQVSEDGTDWRTLVRDTNSTALTYTHSGVPQGATRHYRVQAAVGPHGTGSGSGFGRSAFATTATVPSCGASFPDEIWCAVMTVESENEALSVIGFSFNSYGSLSSTQFNYGGTDYRIIILRYDVEQ